MIDLEWWEERAAILEYDEGMTRFAAETEAARRQGAERWRFIHAKRKRDSQQARDHRSAMERHDADDLPGVLGASTKQDRPVPERDVPAGRDRVPVLALRA